MIPKRIFTIWLNENKEIPELIQTCISTHNLPGYEHKLITLENCDRRTQYVQECIDAKKWVKAADYLRILYLYFEGGIYLDADVKVLKSFDNLLNDKMFLGIEPENNFYANSVIGAEAHSFLLGEYLQRIATNFKGDGDLTFEPGIRAFCDLIFMANKEALGIKIYPSEYFFPYNHTSKVETITENTICYHYFAKSWR